MISGVGSIFGAECEKRGMLIRVAGDSIMLSPPLIMTPGEVEEVRLHSVQYDIYLSGELSELTPSFQIVSKYGDALKATEERIAKLKSNKN